jgi:hypothetical protein
MKSTVWFVHAIQRSIPISVDSLRYIVSVVLRVIPARLFVDGERAGISTVLFESI